MAQLTIVRGLPGSGKTTLSSSLGVLHLEPEQYCIQDGEFKRERMSLAKTWLYRAALEAIRADMDVVVCAVFPTMKELDPFMKLTPNVKVVKCTNSYGSSRYSTQEYQSFKQIFQDVNGEEYV